MKNNFTTFIEQDLREIAVNTAKLEWKRMITQLQSFIHDAESDQETKEKKRSQLEGEKEQLIDTHSTTAKCTYTEKIRTGNR